MTLFTEYPLSVPIHLYSEILKDKFMNKHKRISALWSKGQTYAAETNARGGNWGVPSGERLWLAAGKQRHRGVHWGQRTVPAGEWAASPASPTTDSLNPQPVRPNKTMP